MEVEDIKGASTQSLYATLGLSSEDVEALAQIPDSEISIETLPDLILQLKAKKAGGTAHVGDSRDRLSQESPSSSRSTQRSRSHEKHGHRESHTERPKDYRSSRERPERRDSGGPEVGGPEREEPERDEGGSAEAGSAEDSIAAPREGSESKTRKEHGTGAHYKSRESKPQRSSRSHTAPKRHYKDSGPSADYYKPDTPRHRYIPNTSSRVVVARFPQSAVTLEELLELCRPFGTVVKHVMMAVKGFFEFSSHEEALSMTNHYYMTPAKIRKSKVWFYISPRGRVYSPPKLTECASKRPKISKNSSVVWFSGLPVEEEVEAEVLELASLFGEVEESRFTEQKAFVEMVNWRDAEIMVKYYHCNPLKIQGKAVKVSMTDMRSVRDSSPKQRKSRRTTEESTTSCINTTPEGSSHDPAETEEDVLLEDEDKLLEDEEGVQLEDETGLLDDYTEDDLAAEGEEEATEKGKEQKKKEEQMMKKEEERKEKNKEEGNGTAPVEGEESDEEKAEEELEVNSEDFVTIDELDNTQEGDSALDSSVQQDGKVVLVWPIHREQRLDCMLDLNKMAARFGVVRKTLSLFRRQAMIELKTAENARAMVKYYRSHRARVCGRPVSVSLSHTMKTIEIASGRTVFISGLPCQKFQRRNYPPSAVLNLAKEFGKVNAYCLNRNQGTCYLQMDSMDSAKQMVISLKWPPVRFWGSVLKIAKCKKGDSLILWQDPLTDGYLNPGTQRTARRRSAESDQEPTARATEKQLSPAAYWEGAAGDAVCQGKSSEEENQEPKLPLEPYDPEQAVGLERIIAVSGFFCKLCNIFFSDENRAKSDHCRSLEHYNKLKLEHREVEQTDEQPEG